jgi:hypothetical protein
MDMIKSVNDLPEWFKERKYEKNLDIADWYREIRKRQAVSDTLEKARKNPGMTRHTADEIFQILLRPIPKDWPFFRLNLFHLPVEDMSKHEAIYIASSFKDERSKAAYISFQEVMKVYRHEVNNSEMVVFSRRYEEMLEKHLDNYYWGEDKSLDELAYETVADTNIGGIYLSYGMPLNGYPIVIDTQYDDETILQYVKKWLKERRTENSEKPLKRPFIQNDFDDWSYYKIREVFDLDTWATSHNVKILDKVIAAALWPNAPDEISPLDMLRTTTRKKVKEVFKWEVCVRLYAQSFLERGEKFLEK